LVALYTKGSDWYHWSTQTKITGR